MTNALTLKQRQERAERRVQRFVRRFESSYYDLVCHAALPLVLTPELVSYLRNEFLRELPWIAEVDLLLSDLCTPVGYELYVMDADVRAHVLEHHTDTFNSKRMREVANLLISYVRYLADHSSQFSDQELETQQWAAMLYLGPSERQTVVSEIVERFQSTAAIGTQLGSSLLSKAEMARLAQITQTLKAQLADYPGLIEYASLVSDVQMRNMQLERERIEKTYVIAPGQYLRLPPAMQTELRAKNRIIGVGPRRVSVSEPESSQVLRNDASQVSIDESEELTPDETSYRLEAFEFTDVRLLDETEAEALAFPALEAEEFTVITFQPTSVVDPDSENNLEPFEFIVATIQRRQQQKQAQQWVIQRQQQRAYRFIELLPDDIPLEMVAIPAGTFLMGSPEGEPERFERESPQHEVTVDTFCMGRYPITQAQWQAVATLAPVERELNPDPSRFKGDARPVERVSWEDAVEFFQRLSRHTERPYRLPTEAEWEYACRAGTTTPFHFGETLSSELANYRGTSIYNQGPKGEYREETTPVDHFEIANAFGLSDMHGNVFEWCQDHWHENYEEAPADGSAWLFSDENKIRHVYRGGSWFDYPWYCRSACRGRFARGLIDDGLGFRVCCASPRTL